MTCLLKSLTSSKFEEALPFLEIGAYEFHVAEGKLKCCHGKGLRLCQDSSAVLSCDLKKRVKAVGLILGLFGQTWRKSFQPCSFTTKEFRLYWNWFKLYEHRKIFKGFMIESPLNSKQKELAWTLAMMAAWRFGLKAFVFNLKQHKIHDFIHYVDKNKEEESPPIVFLEVEECLWGLQKREDITYIVSWCEKHLWPLWIINKETKKEPEKVSNLALKMFEKKILKHKQKPFTEWLEKETLSKLSTLCLKISQY